MRGRTMGYVIANSHRIRSIWAPPSTPPRPLRPRGMLLVTSTPSSTLYWWNSRPWRHRHPADPRPFRTLKTGGTSGTATFRGKRHECPGGTSVRRPAEPGNLWRSGEGTWRTARFLRRQQGRGWWCRPASSATSCCPPAPSIQAAPTRSATSPPRPPSTPPRRGGRARCGPTARLGASTTPGAPALACRPFPPILAWSACT